MVAPRAWSCCRRGALVHDDVVDRYDTPREAGRIRRAGRLARRAGQRRRYGEGTVHTASTPLHRGFSCYLFDENWQFLLIRRAASKSVFPVCGPTVSAAIPDLGRATWLRCVAGPGTSSASTSKGCASPWRTFGTALSTTVGWRTRSARCTSAGPASSGPMSLARHLRAEQVTVVEVMRPNRQVRRRHGTTDVVDGIAAARCAVREAQRTLKVLQRSATKGPAPGVEPAPGATGHRL